MKTLPRGGRGRGASVPPSPLRHGASSSDDEDGAGAEDDGDGDGDGDEDEDEESRYGTVASYRTATDGSGASASTTRHGLQDVSWGREEGDSKPNDPEREAAVRSFSVLDPPSRERADGRGRAPRKQLAQAIDALERSIDEWTLPPCGPFVAELGNGENGEEQQR